MRADMTSKISFLALSEEQNEYGEADDNWYPVINEVYASKEPLLGNEYFAADQRDTKVEVKFRTLYTSDFDLYFEDDMRINRMRIKHRTIDYEILSAINVKNLNRELLIYARKVR